MPALPHPEMLTEAVRQKAAGTPYVVTPTPHGFDLALDVVNARWLGLFNKAGMTSSYIHHVTVKPDGTYKIVDDYVTFQWSAGVPTNFRRTRAQGRIIKFKSEKSWGITEGGKLGQITDYTFSSEEGRRIIQTAANSLGLKETMPAVVLIGLVFAVIGGLGAMVTLIFLGARLLNG